MKAWYVAKTKPAKERIVETFLNNKEDVEVFLPRIRRPLVNKIGWEMLFPTYIFCRVDPQSDDWPAIRWAPGLSYFLGAGQELVPVSEEIISHLKNRVFDWNEREYTPQFTPGELLTVTDGPFYGFDAIFQRYIPARQRCQVLIEIMGRLAKAEMPVEAIRSKSPYKGLAFAY